MNYALHIVTDVVRQVPGQIRNSVRNRDNFCNAWATESRSIEPSALSNPCLYIVAHKSNATPTYLNKCRIFLYTQIISRHLLVYMDRPKHALRFGACFVGSIARAKKSLRDNGNSVLHYFWSFLPFRKFRTNTRHLAVLCISNHHHLCRWCITWLQKKEHAFTVPCIWASEWGVSPIKMAFILLLCEESATDILRQVSIKINHALPIQGPLVREWRN